MPEKTFSEKVRRVFAPEEELEAEELREQAADCGAQQLTDCSPRSHVTIRGTVVSVTSDADNGWLEAEVTDGTAKVRLVWMGRSRIECLLPGRNVLVHGRLAVDHKAYVIYNPDFEIVP